jgi:hypothetical protein
MRWALLIGAHYSRQELQSQDAGRMPAVRKATSTATRKIKSRTKTSQLQDELPERVVRIRRVVNGWSDACERVCHPPRGEKLTVSQVFTVVVDWARRVRLVRALLH